MTKNSVEGGAYGGVEELYREVILDHFKTPRNKGRLADANSVAEGMNPLCGDQITISALIDGETIKDVKFEGHGCAISQSSASMMTAALKGKSLRTAEALTTLFKRMFGVQIENAAALPPLSKDDLGDLESLEGVKKYPVRIKCALLAWNTLLEGLENFKKGGHYGK